MAASGILSMKLKGDCTQAGCRRIVSLLSKQPEEMGALRMMTLSPQALKAILEYLTNKQNVYFCLRQSFEYEAKLFSTFQSWIA